MQDDTFLALQKNRRGPLAQLRKRRAPSLKELYVRIERSRLAIARSRLLLSRPVITVENIGEPPRWRPSRPDGKVGH
jgi:hypothetical protein